MPEDKTKSHPRRPDSTKRPSVFAGVPVSIKTLRRHYKGDAARFDTDAFVKEMSGTSDRAVVITLAAMLDGALQTRIAKSLGFNPTDDEIDHIFRFEGPLGTFSGRMEIACLFGIIDDDAYTQLNIIRDMRNASAHSQHALTFSDTPLSNVALRLFEPLGSLPPPASHENNGLRHFFVFESAILFFTLAESREIGRARIAEVMFKSLRPKPPSPSPRKRP